MEQEPIARTALDEMVESDQDQMLKAMIRTFLLPVSGFYLCIRKSGNFGIPCRFSKQP